MGAEPPSPPARKGWIAFAGVYLLVAGVTANVSGLAALTDRDVLAGEGLAWATPTTWGWTSLAGRRAGDGGRTRVLARRLVGRVLAVTVAFGGLFRNFLSVGAYPLWSILALVANGLVLWAVTVYGDAFE